jgi:homoserine kinase
VQKIKIRLPATLTDFSPGLRSLGLAIGLYTHVELLPRDDDQLIVETEGEGAGYYPLGLRHPVVLGMIRILQRLERAPLGITVRVQNAIPLNSGLGAEDAFMAAGVVGASNLLGGAMSRNDLVEMVAQVSPRPDAAITSMLGGLSASARLQDKVLYRSLPLTSFKIILAIPAQADYQQPTFPRAVSMGALLYNTQRIPIILEALRAGNVYLLAQVLDDKVIGEAIQQRISGYAHVAEMARLAGALGVTTSGGGPALVFLAQKHHDNIAEAIQTAFANIGTPALVRVLPLDTQGIVMSMTRSQS